MKRITPGLFLILLFSALAFAQYAVVIKENANLRGTAAASGKVVTVLPFGTEVDVLKQVGGWFLVQSPDYAGWVHGNTIEYRKDGSFVLRAEPTPVYQVGAPRLVPQEAPRSSSTTIAPEIPATPNVTSDSNSIEPVSSTTPTAICNDGTISYSLNHSGTCSHHGGVSSWMDGSSTTSSSPSNNPNTGGTVQVKGYYRKDGTYVRPHTRSAPRRN
jgi:hypothetical protein